jgi:RNA polymerase sigma factor (sigma-70 family)
LIGANLENADLSYTNLRGANLTDTYLLQVIYEGADLRDVITADAVLPNDLATTLGKNIDDETLRRKVLSDNESLNNEHAKIIENLFSHIKKYSHAYSVIGYFDRDDLVQETIIRLSKHTILPKLIQLSDDDRKYYAYTVMKSIASDKRRMREKRVVNRFTDHIGLEDYINTISDQRVSPLEKLIEYETEEILSGIEDILPAKFWRIFKAYYFDGHRSSDIATNENISLTTVHRYLSKAREIVRKHVALEFPGFSA